MKLLVVSDVHGDYQRLCDAVEAEKDADAVIFLGDGLAQAEMLQDEYPALRVYTVRGNCDYASFSPAEALCAFDGVLVFYTHGHTYGVKSGLSELSCAGRARQAQLVLYGHTHIPRLQEDDGVVLFNPGALSGPRASYGVVTLAHGHIACRHVEVK